MTRNVALTCGKALKYKEVGRWGFSNYIIFASMAGWNMVQDSDEEDDTDSSPQPELAVDASSIDSLNIMKSLSSSISKQVPHSGELSTGSTGIPHVPLPGIYIHGS